MRSSLLVLMAAGCGGRSETTTAMASEPIAAKAEPVEEADVRDGGVTAVLAEPEPVAAPLVERIDRATIQRVIRGSSSALKKCYEDGLAKQPDLEGASTVTFTITPAGQVTGAVGTGLDATVDRCLASVVETLSFPAAMYPTQVNFPFKFSLADGRGGFPKLDVDR